jgi:hypothetical protein
MRAQHSGLRHRQHGNFEADSIETQSPLSSQSVHVLVHSNSPDDYRSIVIDALSLS